jgi:hypothetical protein
MSAWYTKVVMFGDLESESQMQTGKIICITTQIYRIA